jgi:Uma2 family endonuclease
MGVAVRKLTWEDIKDLPESHGRTEIVDGELIMSPTAGSRHQQICSALGAELFPHVREKCLGVLFSSPTHVILAEHTHYEPDLCFVAAQRRSIIKEAYIEGPPDLIIEVISESNRSHDTVVKFRDYAHFGVREYWLVDPREDLISTWRLLADHYELLGRAARGGKVTSHVLPLLQLDPTHVLAEGF